MKLSKEPPTGYIDHIRKMALSAAQGVGIEAGARILEEGLKAWPSELDAAIKWIVMERKKLK
ncbi:hypothetical protein [Sphingobacterium prati]|jgi:hypothetical protein|uniref:hypothetical protein n=1 Tax=Sphingobacterium prati TaxID=2737006 RepID=UPI001554997C|nr:hypothetical protein [Sphingobacterium prati]MDF2477484.1 hypothetical protein [Sphingobacterium sp.]NPE47795.1 hypothetical protein [Sphingobacterium prati]